MWINTYLNHKKVIHFYYRNKQKGIKKQNGKSVVLCSRLNSAYMNN